MEDIGILLKKLADKTITASEESFLFEWLRDHKEEWTLSMYDEYRQALVQNTRYLSEEKSSMLLREIHSRVNSGNNVVPEAAGNTSFPRYQWKKWRLPAFYLGVAASLLLLLVFSGQLFLSGIKSESHKTVSSAETVKKIKNAKGHVIPVGLPDGSSVFLYPQSTLTYGPFTAAGVREVFLEGKAFFEIIRNPERPFLVHTGEMVTKVLGTSFMVDAFQDRQHYSVLVKTGSVSVSGKSMGKNVSEEPSSVVLKENEEAIFDRTSEVFIAVNPSPEVKLSEESIMKVPKEYRFRDTPVTDILDMLSRDYNVLIEADREILANCSLTTVLKDKPLFEKLQIVCEGIGQGTSFSVEQEAVVITSLGCNN